jgi:hypothetical protein
MSNQERTQRPPGRSRSNQEIEPSLLSRQTQEETVAEQIQTETQRLDDILDDFLGDTVAPATEVIDGTQSEVRFVRQTSSEEFVREFQQPGGQ